MAEAAQDHQQTAIRILQTIGVVSPNNRMLGYHAQRWAHSIENVLDAAFQAGADSARRECVGIATKKSETLRKAAHVVQQPTEEALRMAELAILTADDLAAAILERVGKAVAKEE